MAIAVIQGSDPDFKALWGEMPGYDFPKTESKEDPIIKESLNRLKTEQRSLKKRLKRAVVSVVSRFDLSALGQARVFTWEKPLVSENLGVLTGWYVPISVAVEDLLSDRHGSNWYKVTWIPYK